MTSQALLSVTSLVTGLILIRRTTDVQYGYYILASSALILLSSLQNAFFSPYLATRMTRLDDAARSALVAGLYRGQRRLAIAFGGFAAIIAGTLWLAGVLDARTGPLMIATVAAAVAVLHRDFFRMVLFAHRHAWDVLRTDACHVVLVVAGVFLATLSFAPAAAAVSTLGVAAVASGFLLARALRRLDSRDIAGAPGMLREIAPLAAWSTAGAAIHWTFSQGYAYLVAATLDVTAVAAIAATRLTVMPVNMLSTGAGLLMLPLVSRWLHEHGAALVLRRLTLFALGLLGASLCYFVVLWLTRDWIFAAVLKKQFAQRDQLLMIWSAAFLVMVLRDQLVYFVAARGLFRMLTSLTLVSAVVSLTVSYWGMQRFGVAGAPLGVLVGELITLGGIVIMSVAELRRQFATPSLATSGS